MLDRHWAVLGFLACVALTDHFSTATPQDVVSIGNRVDVDIDDFVTEDEMDDNDLMEIADEIAENIQNQEDDSGFARGKLGSSFSFAGRGLKKKGKRVGGAFMTAGDKLVQVTGKGVKVKGPMKGGKFRPGSKNRPGKSKPGKNKVKPGKNKVKPGNKIKPGKNTKKPGKGTKKPGKGTKKPGKGTKKPGKDTKKPGKDVKVAKTPANKLKNAGKNAKDFVTKKGQMVWKSLKNKMGGDAGIQLLKTVGKEILEQGASLAVEAVTPMILEYLVDKTQEGLCSCEGTVCNCCVQPPGFNGACITMTPDPKKKSVKAAIKYSGNQIAELDITKQGGKSTCSSLSGLASFIRACMSPIGIGEFDGGFRGCVDVTLKPLSLQRPLCIDYKGSSESGSANFVPPSQIEEVEIEYGEEEDEEEEEEEEEDEDDDENEDDEDEGGEDEGGEDEDGEDEEDNEEEGEEGDEGEEDNNDYEEE